MLFRILLVLVVTGGTALETAHKVTAVLFDKTGTLTTGKPALSDVVSLFPNERTSDQVFPRPSLLFTPAPKLTPPRLAPPFHFCGQILSLAAGAEQNSEHPVGRALLMGAQGRRLPTEHVTDFQPDPGYGVVAATQHGRVLVGTGRLMAKHGLRCV